MPLPQLWSLALAWYHNRLDLDYTGRTVKEAEAVFRAVGLLSPFWSAERV